MTVGSETGGFGTCAPVVEYSREFQARTAEELSSLPHRSAIADMLNDYAVMRDQARACVARFPRRRRVASRGISKVLQP